MPSTRRTSGQATVYGIGSNSRHVPCTALCWHPEAAASLCKLAAEHRVYAQQVQASVTDGTGKSGFAPPHGHEVDVPQMVEAF